MQEMSAQLLEPSRLWTRVGISVKLLGMAKAERLIPRDYLPRSLTTIWASIILTG